jgi:tetratricopeptide (TPR) repeat protein
VWDRTLVGDHDATMATLLFLGASAQQLGAWEAADDYQRRAHEMAIRLHGEHHPTTAAFLRDWANSVLNQAEAADAPDERERLGRVALDKADRAAADLEASLGVENPESAQAQLTRCRTSLLLRELDRAASACEQALAVLRRAHGADSPLLTESLLVLGVVHHARGELAPAHAALEEALTRGAAGDPLLLADAQFELAKVLGDLGQSRRAVELARAARPALAADARTGESLAELDAWLAARRRPVRRAQPPTN